MAFARSGIPGRPNASLRTMPRLIPLPLSPIARINSPNWRSTVTFSRRIGGLQVVNPGSLGMRVDGDPRRCYAVLQDGRIGLKRVEYDVQSAVKRLYDTRLPQDIAQGMERVGR